MHSRGMAGLVLAAAGLMALTAGCSAGSGWSTGPGGGESSLVTALGRVGATANTRGQVYYSDIAALAALAHGNLGGTTGFAPLAGEANPGPAYGGTGISLAAADYEITAGGPPASLTLLAGGQDAGAVTRDLIKDGWARQGNRLAAPGIAAATTAVQIADAQQMAQVIASGPDVRFGESGADLAQAGQPAGPALAADPVVGALARCLGDVVTAQIGTYDDPGLQARPAGVAVGVLSPASDTAVPRAVVCTAWPAAAAAATYQRDLGRALSAGSSARLGEPYSRLLSGPSVRDAGGAQHIVAWQASTPGNAALIFDLFLNQDLPALPDCARLAPAARAGSPGCG